MTRIEKKFKELKIAHKKAFITFITAGYPSLKVTEQLILAFDRVGVDIVELGVPFTDPLADGPIIQEASTYALKKNITLAKILSLVKRVRAKTTMPLCVMTYYNPIFCFGEEKFLKQAVSCGVDGVIIPDLPPEEGKKLISLANRHGIDVICFIAPTSSLKRIKYIAKVSRGFIYYVSLTGVTGMRNKLPLDLTRQLKLVKKTTSKPVCVGFGISNPAQVRQIHNIADGVIVGSAIIRQIKENIGKPDLIHKVSTLVQRLKGDA